VCDFSRWKGFDKSSEVFNHSSTSVDEVYSIFTATSQSQTVVNSAWYCIVDQDKRQHRFLASRLLGKHKHLKTLEEYFK